MPLDFVAGVSLAKKGEINCFAHPWTLFSYLLKARIMIQMNQDRAWVSKVGNVLKPTVFQKITR